MNKTSSSITLKPQRQPELFMYVLTWLFLVTAFYFFCKWESLLPHAKNDLSAFSSTIIIALVSIPVSVVSVFITENQKIKNRRWLISSDMIQFVQSGFGSMKLEVQVSDIASIRFGTYNLMLERGIRICGKNGVRVFIPQLTDRFYEAEQFLREIVETSLSDR